MNRAFTLVELLVVIAIIGVLASIVTVSLSSASNRAKDTSVITGMKQYATLLQAERAKTGSYAGLRPVVWIPGTTAQTCAGAIPNTSDLYLQAEQLCDKFLDDNSAVTNGAGQKVWLGCRDGNCTTNPDTYSLMVLLPSSAPSGNKYACIGSSGVFTQATTNGYGSNSTGGSPIAGCWGNP